LDSLLEPIGGALAVMTEGEIVADDHGLGFEVVFEDGLVELFGGAVSEFLGEWEDDGGADAERFDELEILVESVDGERGSVGGENFGGVAVEGKDDAREEFLVSEFDGFFDEGLVAEVYTVEGADTNNRSGPFGFEMIGAEVDQHCG
jgi:hypothetical protein